MYSLLFKSRKLFVPLLISIVFFIFAASAFAQGPNSGLGGGPNSGLGSGPNTSIWGEQGDNFLDNPLAVDSICDLVNLLLQAALVIGIPIAVLFIVYAGFKFIIARGSSEGLNDAKRNFFYTLIGVAIFIGASLIASVILNTLVQLGVTGAGAC